MNTTERSSKLTRVPRYLIGVYQGQFKPDEYCLWFSVWSSSSAEIMHCPANMTHWNNVSLMLGQRRSNSRF